MAIYRGAGGAGDAVADSSSEALLIRELVSEAQVDADAAASSASAASSSASAAASSASAASTSATNAANSAASVDVTLFARKANNLSDLTSASTARTNLGLGTLATQSASAVSITGGSVTGITDLTVSDGGTGASTFTSNAVLLGNGTSSFQTVSPSTNGNILTSNGTTWISQAPAASGGFDAGTRMMFAQTSAPTGWTKDTTNYNNHALRVVTGAASTGGSVAFTTAFASQTPTISNTLSIDSSGLSVGSTTLTTSQIPSHTHTVPIRSPGCFAQGAAVTSFDNNSAFPNSGSTGGGGSHNHSISGSATLSGGITSSAINLAVQYLDVITATKN